jgi:hypothetical protein
MANKKSSKHAVKKKAPKSSRPSGTANKSFAIQCTDGCGATTEMLFSGSDPYGMARLAGQGWAVLNSPEDNTIAFLCPECFRKLEPEDVVEHDTEGLIDIQDCDDDDDGGDRRN